jgi:hypothetical protein
MEAIKKKMQSMKVEKDNLMDRCDICEQVQNRLIVIRSCPDIFSPSQLGEAKKG